MPEKFASEDASLVEGQRPDERETWTGRLDFLVSCVGAAVGLGNIWRFPYLCYKNGGGAFLIPYILVVIFCGVPLFLLEISLGQFMKKGPVRIWNMCPLMKGIGYCTTVVSFYTNTYYIMVLTWAVYYFYRSFTLTLPWSNCNNAWNTQACVSATNTTKLISANNTYNISNTNYVDAVDEFWEKEVLQISGGITEVGSLRIELAVCLLVAWLVCYVCICKGIKTTGKIVYFTALFPYVVLIAFVIRGITLEGSMTGIQYYLTPNWTKLQESQVWVDAGTQVFFSYFIGFGALPALGSYNKYHNNCIRDTFIIATVNSLTSFLAGFVVFSFLGFMAEQRGMSIADIATSGPGLVFIVYPKAMNYMPFAPFWSCLFFFMVILLGLDSQFVCVEGILTSLTDIWPKYFKKKRVQFSGILCFVFFMLGLPMVTQGGMYVFQVFDYYSASGMTLLWLAAWEAIAVSWIFGVDKYMKMLQDMVGYSPDEFLKWCWLVFTPMVSLGIMLFLMVSFVPLKYNSYVYPKWATSFGLTLALSSMVCIPIGALHQFFTCEGRTLKEKLINSIQPKYGNHQHHLVNKTKTNCFEIKLTEDIN